MAKGKSTSRSFGAGWLAVLGIFSIATVILMTIGLWRSEFGENWQVLCWLIASMSLFWVANRLLHGLGGIGGETERDGIIWLCPLSAGTLPALLFLIVQATTVRSVVVLFWGFSVAIMLQFLRPETPGETQHRELPLSILTSLFQYQLNPVKKRVPPKFRFSTSTLIFYGGFSSTASALIWSQELLKDRNVFDTAQAAVLLGIYFTAALAILGTFAAGIFFTYNAPSDKMGYSIEKGEQQILTFLYTLCTFDILLASGYWFALPLARLIL